MNKHCNNCGAILDTKAKICTNCGKVVSLKKAKNQQMPQQGHNQKQTSKKNKQGQPIPQKVYEHPKAQSQPLDDNVPNVPQKRKKPPTSQAELDLNAYEPTFFEYKTSSGKEELSKIKPIFKRIVKIAFLFFVFYFVFSSVRILTVSFSGYEFETQMTLESDTYREAMSNYFSEGSWEFSPLKNKVYYEGEKDGEEYVLTFEQYDGRTYCDSMTIDGEEVKSDNLMETYIMGMFMATKKI